MFSFCFYMATCTLPQIVTSRGPVSNFQLEPSVDLLESGQCDAIYGEPNADNCRSAIDQLPDDIPSDITFDGKRYIYPRFSRTMANPRLKLPISALAGDCEVTVSIAPKKLSDTSLWSIIRRRARAIILDCIQRHDGIGGLQNAGDEGSILIVLKEIEPEMIS